MQVNWNWLFKYTATGKNFVDLSQYSDIIDLVPSSDTAMNACTVADSFRQLPSL